ncbi:MAG: hypothetical protein WD557_07100 [Dehalococcoidia bacterium]
MTSRSNPRLSAITRPEAKAPSPLSRRSGRGAGGEGTKRPARTIVRVTALTLSLLCVSAIQLATAQSVSADGEVGVVIEEDGQVRTYCVPFTGDSIAGDDLLGAAGLNYEDLGTGAGAVLCAIEEVGCFDASSFNTCWCECQGTGGSDCVYWAFFTRDHGAGWVYSARAFDRIDANDGDLHAWKWGQGGPSSAPRPSEAITFESVCGHAPRAGAPLSATASTQPTLVPTFTQPPGTGTGNATAPPTGTDTPFSTALAPTSASPGVSVTFIPRPNGTPPQPPATALDEEDDGGSPLALVAFGVVAVGLLGAIGAAAYWRRGHGA